MEGESRGILLLSIMCVGENEFDFNAKFLNNFCIICLRVRLC